MKKAARTLMIPLMVGIGVHAGAANAGAFKLRVSSGDSPANENLLASYGSSQSTQIVDHEGGGGGARNNPLDLLANLEDDSNDDGNPAHELTQFESPEGGVTDVLDIPIESEVIQQAVPEPSTLALLLAPVGLLLARRAR